MKQEEQFLSVLDSNKGILYKVANSYCHNAEDRKDLIQEIVIQLWKSFENYNDQYKYSTWIYRISLNVAITFYHKENRRRLIANPVTEDILYIMADNFSIDNSENINLLMQFIAGLREIDKGLMLLVLEEKSYKEIAEILGITETNVATKISRIKNQLKQKFSTV